LEVWYRTKGQRACATKDKEAAAKDAHAASIKRLGNAAFHYLEDKRKGKGSET
jgi:hypothetical protein